VSGVTSLVRCVECGAEPDDGKGWRAYIADDLEGDRPSYAVFFCPEWALRELGPLRLDD
jgi:hypothetical protein